jgi:hypothetical protein
MGWFEQGWLSGNAVGIEIIVARAGSACAVALHGLAAYLACLAES